MCLPRVRFCFYAILFVKFSLAILNLSIFSVNFLTEKKLHRKLYIASKNGTREYKSMPKKMSLQDKLLCIITLTRA